MKVGYFTHTNISPSETFIYDLVKGLNAQEDIDLTFVSGQKTSVAVDFELNSISTGFFTNNETLSFQSYKLGSILGGRGNKYKIKVKKISAYKALNKAKLPKFDVAFVDYATSAFVVQEYLHQKSIPFIVNVNGYDVTAAVSDYYFKQELLILFQRAVHFIAPSHHLRRRLILNGYVNNKISVLPYGIDVKKISPLSWEVKKQSVPSITFLGRLTEKKNPIALIYAFSLVVQKRSDAVLNILGGGDLMLSCKQKVKELGIEENVRFFGVVDRKKGFEILNSSWVYAQHSVTSNSGDQEGFPVSLAEAAAHALPLVSTIHSGITENIIDGETGFLVQEHNFEAMAEKILYLIENPDIAKEMGRAGREHIMSICNPELRVEAIQKLLFHAYK